jgi:CheY-like chemotaxis protein
VPRILVVDDDKAFIDTVAVVLKADGHRVTRAEDGIQFSKSLASDKPDLIILDIQMPGGGGPQAVRALQATPATASIPVVFCSGMPVDEMIAWFPETPSRRYLRKPIDLKLLRACIDELISNRGA